MLDELIAMLSGGFMEAEQRPENKVAVATYMDAIANIVTAAQKLSAQIESAATALENGLPIDQMQASQYQNAFNAFKEAENTAHIAFHQVIGTNPDHDRDPMETLNEFAGMKLY